MFNCLFGILPISRHKSEFTRTAKPRRVPRVKHSLKDVA
jgi:hypothetical protein